MNMLIDIHHHTIPDCYTAAMRKEGMEEKYLKTKSISG
jgi:hypothetical protein